MAKGRRELIAAAALFALTLVMFWPGYALYDTDRQFEQVLSGRFDDWHPPVMVVLWRGVHQLVGGGAGSMLGLQLGGWWLGLGLLAAATRRGAVLAIGLLPPLLGWQVAVLKDAQLAGAMVAATGLIGWWRLCERRLPAPAVAGAAVLLGYAMLVRANAVFAVAPFVALLPTGWPWGRRVGLAVVLTVGGLAVAGPVNHDLFGASRSGVERTQAIYDLAGIAARVDGPVPGLTEVERAAIRARECASVYFWDPLGDERRCAGDVARLHDLPVGRLYGGWLEAVTRHPFAYATHRVAHLNSTERWWVPARWPGAAPPLAGEPTTLGLRDPSRVAAGWQAWAGLVSETPLGWPIIWVIVAAAAFATALPRPPGGRRSLVLALAGSALAAEASFAVVSIASDLRYHLWPMTASALAAALVLGDGHPSRHVVKVAGAALGLVVLTGGWARATLPEPPRTYAGMLDWHG